MIIVPRVIESESWEKTLQYGAFQAVSVCMGVKSGEKVFIITDLSRESIGNALYDEAVIATGSSELVKLVFLEDERYGTRPFDKGVPKKLEEDLLDFKPAVTFYAASGQKGELNFRIPLVSKLLIEELKVRHAHMINVTEQIMTEAMCGDYEKIAEMSKKVFDIVKAAKQIKVTTAEGTNLTFDLNPNSQWTDLEGVQHYRWINSDGIWHEQGKWGNLPDGEVFTAPMNVNGTMVITGVLGDYFDQKYGPLKHPVKIEIVNSRAVSISCEDEALAEELNEYIHSKEDSDRVGELGIGTNEALENPIGNMLQDEKIPGVHVAFGNPYPNKTGAAWDADTNTVLEQNAEKQAGEQKYEYPTTHVDGVILKPTIEVDGKRIMFNGKFELEQFDMPEMR